MSVEVDERVVEMRFKNSDFETKARSTISTLDRLDEKLEFKKSKDGLKSFGKALKDVDLNPLSKAVETVHVKIDAMQVAAVTALQRITNSAIDTGMALVKSLSVDQVTEGFSKYEQKTAAVQTIMNATGKTIDEVSQSLEKLNWFTDETSYNFVDMVNNIGKFTSAGVDLDVAITAMEGIANVAAISGQGINEASRAMYNFAQAIGTGKVQLIDWKSIENANMATQEFKQTIIDSALAEGTLVKTADGLIKTLNGSEVSVIDFNSALKDSWFTSDVLIKSLGRYGEFADKVYTVTQEEGILCAEAMAKVSDGTKSLGERAFRAAQEAKTFTDAINATKDAVSTGWMSSFEIIFGNYKQAAELWTELSGILYDIFAQGGETRNELLKEAVGTSNWDKFISAINDAGLATEDFEKELKKTVDSYGMSYDKLLEEAGSLEKVVVGHGWAPLITKTLNRIADEETITGNATEDLTERFEELQNVVKKVRLGDFGNGAERVKALTAAGYDYKEVQALVNKEIANGKITLDDLSDEMLESMGYTKEQVESLRVLMDQSKKTGVEFQELVYNLNKKSGRELLIDSFRIALTQFQKVLEIVGQAWNDVFPPLTSERIYELIEQFHTFMESLKLTHDTSSKLRRTFKGLFSILDILRQVFKGVATAASTILGKVFKNVDFDILEFTANIGDNISAFNEWLKENDTIATKMANFGEALYNTGVEIKSWVSSVLSVLGVTDWFEGLFEAFGSFWAQVTDLDNISLDKPLEVFKKFRDTVISYITGIDFSNVNFGFDTVQAKIGDFKEAILPTLGNILKDVGEKIKSIATFILGLIKSINPLIFIPIMFIGIIKGMNEMTKAIAGLEKVLKPLDDVKKSVISAVSSMSNAFNKYLKAKKWAEYGKVFKNFGVAVLLMAGSMWIISTIPTDKLILATAALGIMVLGLIAAGNQVAKNSRKLRRTGTVFMELAASLVLFVGTLKLMETLNTDRIFSGLLTLGILCEILVIVIKQLSKVKGELPTGALFLLSFAVSIVLLVKALSVLNDLNIEGIGKKLLALGELFIGFVAIIAVTKGLDGAAAFGLIAIVGSIWLLMLALESVAKFDPYLIIKNLGAFISVFGTLFLLIKMESKMGGAEKGGGGKLLAVALSVLVLVPAITALGKMDQKRMWSAVAAVSTMALVFGLIIRISKYGSKYGAKAGAMTLMMAGAIAGLSLVIWGLSKLDGKGLAQGTAVVDSMLLLFALIIRVSKGAENAYKTLYALTVSVAILAAAVSLMAAFVDVDKAIKASAALGILMLSMAASLLIIGKSEQAYKGAFKTLFGMTLIMVLLGGLVAGLTLLGPESVLPHTLSLSALLLAMAAACKILADIEEMPGMALASLYALSLVMGFLSLILLGITKLEVQACLPQVLALSVMLGVLSGVAILLSKFGNFEKDIMMGWATMGVLTLVMAALAGIMLWIRDLDGEAMIKQVGALSVAILALSVCASILGKLGTVVDPAAAAKGALDFAIITAIIIVIVAAIGGINKLMKELIGEEYTLEAFMEEATGVFTALGQAIGGFIGGIFGAIGETMSDHFPAVADNLSEFANRLNPFINIMGSLDAPSVASLTGIIDAVMKITAAAFLTSIADFYSWLMGNGNAFESLGSGLVDFGAALIRFSNIAYQIKNTGLIDPLTEVLGVTETLIQLLNQIPSVGGIVHDWFGGNTTWSNLSDGLVDYGDALITFGEKVEGLTDNHIAGIDRSVGSTETLIGLLEQIPSVGGYVDEWFGGTISWSNLADGLAHYGRALFSYGGVVAGMTPAVHTAIENSVDSGKALAELMGTIPSIGGVVTDWFATKGTWDSFSDGLVVYGKCLYDFGYLMKEAQDNGYLSPLTLAVNVSKTLAEVLKTVQSIKADNVVKVIKKLNKDFDEFGKMLKNIAENTKDIKLQNVNTALGAVENLAEFQKTLPSSSMFSTKNQSLSSFASDVEDFATKIAKASKTLDESPVDKFHELATNLIAGFTSGIYANVSEAEDAMDTFSTSVITRAESNFKINSPSRVFGEIAGWCVKGFDNTMIRSSSETVKAVTVFTDAVEETTRDNLGVHSESTLFQEIANWCTTAFNNALEKGKTLISGTIGGYKDTILDSLGIDGITSAFSDMGLDIGETFGSDLLGGIKLDNLIDKTDEYTKKIAEKKAELSELKKTYGATSDAVIKCQNELNALEDEFKEYKKMRSTNTEFFDEQELENAKKEFDAFFDDYCKGRIKQSEYDKKYTELLTKYNKQQGELLVYSTDQMRSHIEDSFEQIQNDYESKLGDIRSKMESVQGNVVKPFDEAFTITTNKTVYDEKVEKYEKQLDVLNAKLDQSKRVYGENSIQVQNYEKSIESLTDELEAYKTFYVAEGFDDDEVLKIDYNDTFVENTKAINDYTDSILKLRELGASQELIDWFSSQSDMAAAKQYADYLGTLSKAQLKTIDDNYKAQQTASKNLAEALHGPEIEQATDEYQAAILSKMRDLPDTAKSIGIDVIRGMTNGFSEETENSLAVIGKTGDDIIGQLKEVFDIHSPSEVTRTEIGHNLADGTVLGWMERLTVRTPDLISSLKTALSTMFDTVINDKEVVADKLNTLISTINQTIAEGIDARPVIRPILDLTDLNDDISRLGGIIPTGTYFTGKSVQASDPRNQNDSNLGQNNDTNTTGGTTFNQYNYSPEPLSRETIYHDTKRMFTWANAKV